MSFNQRNKLIAITYSYTLSKDEIDRYKLDTSNEYKLICEDVFNSESDYLYFKNKIQENNLEGRINLHDVIGDGRYSKNFQGFVILFRTVIGRYRDAIDRENDGLNKVGYDSRIFFDNALETLQYDDRKRK